MKKKKKVSKIKKFFRAFGDVAYISIFVVSAYIFITTYMGHIPSIAGFRFLRAVGGSMEPAIEKGDCIIIRKVHEEDVKEGDVITFFSDDPQIYGYPNTHRVVEVIKNPNGSREFVTRGDYNSVNDPVTAKGYKLIGKYVGDIWISRAITKLFEILSNTVVYFIFMILPLVLGLVANIIDLVKIIREIDEDESVDKTVTRQ